MGTILASKRVIALLLHDENVSKGGGGAMPKKLNAMMDDERTKRLYHALVDDDISFTEWLRRAIDWYLDEKTAGVVNPFEPQRGKKAKGRQPCKR